MPDTPESTYRIDTSKVGVAGDKPHVEGGVHISETHEHHYHRETAPCGKPLQLPLRPRHFTNRKAELRRLLDDLRPGTIVTLCGPGGMGKSALAAEALWRLTAGEALPEQFPDGVIWHDFYTAPQSGVALEAIARMFGVEPSPTPLAAAQCALAGKKALLLLDGTEDTDNLPAVLSACGTCGVIVTTRIRRDAPDQREDIRPLEQAEAVELLRKWGGDQAGDECAAREICELVGGLPLAVRLVGRYLRNTGDTAPEYLAWLRENPFEALDPDDQEHRLESVPWLIERSLEQVGEIAKQVLGMAGVLAFSPFGREAVGAAFSEYSKADIKKALSQLVNYGLLNRIRDRWQMAHALIHTYARERLQPPESVNEHLTGYYIAFVHEQNEQGAEGFARLDCERTHVLAVLYNCADDLSVLALISAIERYCTYQGYYTEFRAAAEYGLIVARRLNDRAEEANCMKALGDVHRMLDEYEEARERYEEARPIYNQIGDRLGEANCMKALGDVHIRLDEYEEARERYEEARPIYNQIGDRYSIASTLAYLGLTYQGMKQIEQARSHLQQAIDIFKAIKSPYADLVRKWLEALDQ